MGKTQIFISYRREGGDLLAGRISDRLVAGGYSVFFDRETMHSGRFNEQIVNAIKECSDVVLVLPPNALDRCINEDDWVRQEIALALENNKNIIPVMMNGFTFPAILSPEINDIRNMEGVADTSEYFDAMMKRIEEFLSFNQKTTPESYYTVGNVIDGKYKVVKILEHSHNYDVFVSEAVNSGKLWCAKAIYKYIRDDGNVEFNSYLRYISGLLSCTHPSIPTIVDIVDNGDHFWWLWIMSRVKLCQRLFKGTCLCKRILFVK